MKRRIFTALLIGSAAGGVTCLAAETPNEVTVGSPHDIVAEGEHRSNASSTGPSKSCPCPDRLLSPSRAKYTSPFGAYAPPVAYHHRWSSFTFWGGRND